MVVNYFTLSTIKTAANFSEKATGVKVEGTSVITLKRLSACFYHSECDGRTGEWEWVEKEKRITLHPKLESEVSI